jgi:hypothetical protein
VRAMVPAPRPAARLQAARGPRKDGADLNLTASMRNCRVHHEG